MDEDELLRFNLVAPPTRPTELVATWPPPPLVLPLDDSGKKLGARLSIPAALARTFLMRDKRDLAYCCCGLLPSAIFVCSFPPPIGHLDRKSVACDSFSSLLGQVHLVSMETRFKHTKKKKLSVIQTEQANGCPTSKRPTTHNDWPLVEHDTDWWHHWTTTDYPPPHRFNMCVGFFFFSPLPLEAFFFFLWEKPQTVVY